MNSRLHYLALIKYSACNGTIRPSHRQESIRKCLAEWILLREYWNKEDSLEVLSDKSGVTKEEMAAFIIRHTGVRYLTLRKELRIYDAKELILQNPEMTIYEISEMVGLTDKSNFRKNFTELIGVSPSVWRSCNGSWLKYIFNFQAKGGNHCLPPHKSS